MSMILNPFLDVTVVPATIVIWTNKVGVSDVAGKLTDTASSGWGNSGGFSTQNTTSFTKASHTVDANGAGTSRLWGLSRTDPNQSYATIEYGWLLQGSTLYVFESAALLIGPLSLILNDVLSIEYLSGSNQIVYAINGGGATRTVSVPSGPYYVDAALETNGSTIGPIILT